MQGGRAPLQLVIRPADLLSKSQLFEAVRNRARIEAEIRDSLSKFPLDIAFDWTQSRATMPDGYVIIDHAGRPVTLPHRLAALRTANGAPIRDALAPF